MRLASFAFALCLFAALAIVWTGYDSAALWQWRALILASSLALLGGIIWREWLGNLGFLGLVVCIAIAAVNHPLGWENPLAICLALAAWDLASLLRKLRWADGGYPTWLPGRHLLLLAGVISGGLLAMLVARDFTFRLGFEAAIGLGLATAGGLAYAVRAMREREGR